METIHITDKNADMISYNFFHRSLESIRKAKRLDRKRPIYEMLLMMFRSANRDKLGA